MNYPATIECKGLPRPLEPISDYNDPCLGTATRLKSPPLDCTPERGDWYGCPKCARVAQYQDFVTLQEHYDKKVKEVKK